MIIVIKVGTQSILSDDGTPNEPVMVRLVEQIVSAQQSGHHVILVSSGAVGSGRKVASQQLGRMFGSSLGEKQLLASLGQHELMHHYSKMFKAYGFLASQLLLTKQDFQTRNHYLNISRLIREILNHKNIIPIINENDSVAIEELMFTDNDELAGLIAALVNADKLVILSHVKGVYTGHPDEAGAELIPIIRPEENWPQVSAAKSNHGRGGMQSKLNTARKMSDLGISTHIASIDELNIIPRIVQQEAVGTEILPNKKKSGIKRWMAYNSDKKMGTVSVNLCLQELLLEGKRALSLLPVGIEHCSGSFKKGDLVEILSLNGQALGIGIAQYDAAKLSQYLGKKDMPKFIHYDYLHIF